MIVETAIAALSLVVWLVLVFGRGGFWRIETVDPPIAEGAGAGRRVLAIVPARNEAEVIGKSVGSLLAQRFAGRLEVVVVDDQSTDATARIVEALAGGAGGRLRLLRGRDPEPGWTGKLWALHQGLGSAAANGDAALDFVWLTDADIVHAPEALARLVATAESGAAVLVSRMALLNCQSPAERWLVPAFVFFFRKLYPFAWINRPDRRTAGAAGGSVLVRYETLIAAGGIAAIKDALIDDCTLAALMKKHGPIHLAMTRQSVSIRPYPHLADIAVMVTRSAYAQLGYSPLNLLGTVIGMLFIYLAPPILAIAGAGMARWLGLAAYLLMVGSYIPMLRFYRLSPFRALALPLIAALYTLFTIDSAVQFMMAKGGAWKGRYQARPGVGRPR